MNILIDERKDDGLNAFRGIVNGILITIFMGLLVGCVSVLYFITVLILRYFGK